jgi:type VI protein secretion system component VasK
MSGPRLRLYELTGLLLRRPIVDAHRRAFWWALAIIVPAACILAVILHLVVGGGAALLIATGAVLAVVLAVPVCGLAKRRYGLDAPDAAGEDLAPDPAAS